MTDLYAVIGNPISHSKSPRIHQAFAEQTRQDIGYTAIESPLDGFAATVAGLRTSGYRGCNVTVPFKFEAFALCQQLSDRAKAAGAVNTLSFVQGEIHGDNTDGAGLLHDLQRNLHCPVAGKRVLLMGAGGAAAGVLAPLLSAGGVVTMVNRTAAKAHHLATQFTHFGKVSSCGYEELLGQRFDLVINATASSLQNDLPPLPQGVFAADALAYDMMYGRDTPFLQFAQSQGIARRADGLGMLVEQAAEAFFIWRGVRAETASVLRLLSAT